MLDFIYEGFGYVIKFLYSICNNYLVAMLLFAVLIKVLLFPLGIKQQKNSIRQANLRPKEMAIRKRYAGREDKVTQQKMQQEIMDLYQKENFNPMSGCLPLVIQLPILLIIYKVIVNPLQYITGVSAEHISKLKELLEMNASESGFNLINKLREVFEAGNVSGDITNILGEYSIKSAADLPKFEIFGWDLSVTPHITEINWYILVPILTFVFMFFGMKITRKFTYNATEGTGTDAAKSMALMDWVMPLMSVYISVIVPAILGIYWIFQNILGTLQQIILAKIYPVPKFTEEDYKRAEKEMNGKIKPEKRTQPSGKKVRSLHHIDDEDYDEIYEKKTEQKKPAPKQKGLAGMIDKPEVKKDEDPEKTEETDKTEE